MRITSYLFLSSSHRIASAWSSEAHHECPPSKSLPSTCPSYFLLKPGRSFWNCSPFHYSPGKFRTRPEQNPSLSCITPIINQFCSTPARPKSTSFSETSSSGSLMCGACCVSMLTLGAAQRQALTITFRISSL